MSYDSHELIETLASTGWLVGAELDLACRVASEAPDRRALAKRWLDYGILNAWQTRQIFAGQRNFLCGNYLLLDFLGEGATGRVFLAKHRYMDRPAALKLIRHECTDDPTMLRRILDEARLLIAIQHPNLAGMYDMIRTGDRYALVLEYVEGTDLQRHVSHGEMLSLSGFLAMAQQITDGLAALHDAGLVHGDLKPANLVVCGTDRCGPGHGVIRYDVMGTGPRVRLIDLGVSRFEMPADSAARGPVARHDPAEESVSLDEPDDFSQLPHDLSGDLSGGSSLNSSDGRRLLMRIGSFDYLAPERARVGSEPTPASDLYALGCVFYFMLCGEPPFLGGNWSEKLIRHLREEPEPLAVRRPELPTAVGRLVERLLLKDPLRRGTIGNVGSDLHAMALRCRAELFDEGEFLGGDVELSLGSESGDSSCMISLDPGDGESGISLETGSTAALATSPPLDTSGSEFELFSMPLPPPLPTDRRRRQGGSVDTVLLSAGISPLTEFDPESAAPSSDEADGAGPGWFARLCARFSFHRSERYE